jgi:hypothetical protein
MSSNRIILRALRVLSGTKAPAEVVFTPGFNVISGASNTGKSYILQSLDFIFGSSDSPKPIDESIGYETVQADIQNALGKTFTIERSLKGGDARVWASGLENPNPKSEILGQRHNPNDKRTISGFFLEASGLWGRKVKINQQGKVRPLSFRDLARLILVDENRIISDLSPALTGQYVNASVETSVFNMLLSGVDDSSIVSSHRTPENRRIWKAHVQVLGQIIADTDRDLLNLDKEPTTLAERKEKLDAAIRSRTEALDETAGRIEEQETVRQESWDLFRAAEAKRSANEDLSSRFQLLEQHYRNDIARLQAIIEADHFFTQLRQERCPLCGAPPETHDPESACRPESLELTHLREACVREVTKVTVLLKDLAITTEQLRGEADNFRREAAQHRTIYREAGSTIKQNLEPTAKSEQKELQALTDSRATVVEAYSVYSRLLQLKKEKAQMEKALAARDDEPTVPTVVLSQAVERFALRVDGLLRSWAYPGLTRVTFSEQDLDLIVSGRRRATEGKGLRAISYAAFTIGLLLTCKDMDLPHPGLVVLDSPLVTYKRRDVQPGETIPDDVKTAFFRSLVDLPPEVQVVILENEDPPEDVRPRINYMQFSRSRGIGRYGFFPVT